MTVKKGFGWCNFARLVVDADRYGGNEPSAFFNFSGEVTFNDGPGTDVFFSADDLFGPAEEPANTDCNDNGIPDSCDISGDLESDADADGIPDSCQESDSGGGGSSGGGCGIIPVSGPPSGMDLFEHYAGLLLLLILVPRLHRARKAQAIRA